MQLINPDDPQKDFQIIKTFKGGSKASTLLVWQDDMIVVKKIVVKQYKNKLRAQYIWLKQHQDLPEIPHVLREHRNTSDYYAIDLEYREEYVPFFDVIHSSSARQNREILLTICNFMDTRIHTPQKTIKNAPDILNEYINTKAIDKITASASDNTEIAKLLSYSNLIINGRKVDNFEVIIGAIISNKEAMADLVAVVECPIQGDLTIDNLIVNPTTNQFIILDPNNENFISDPMVDYAKLMQSLHSGYEFINLLPSCAITDNYISFEEHHSAQYETLYKDLCIYLRKRLPVSRYRSILFHEAIHYCRLLTYRTTINPDTAAIYYCIAIRLLNDFLGQYSQ